MDQTIVFQDACILDCTGRDLYTHGALVVSGGRIAAVGPMARVSAPPGARVIDVAGQTLMPGLIDAHVHLGFALTNLRQIEAEYPGAVYAFTVARMIEACLMAGFTTVRDAGGTDWSFKYAVERGLIRGPRLLIANSFLSQTGGHGDWRQRYDRAAPACFHQLMAPPCLCDGVDQVRRGAREQLRTGADWVKVMAGGGAVSPTDPLDVPQFTVEELAAAVYEARVVRKKVMAHVYVPEGIKNCVRAGIASIEHGNFLDEESAALMRQHGVVLVPTLAAYEVYARYGREQGASEETLQQIELARGVGPESLRVAMAAGVTIASGSDVYGQNAGHMAMELALKAHIMGNMASIMAATKTNAALLGLADQIGTLESGKLADVIVVNGNPLEDITLLQHPDRIAIVMQAGHLVKGAA
jgi:imidazolonepropionase-like amidohydrolase